MNKARNSSVGKAISLMRHFYSLENVMLAEYPAAKVVQKNNSVKAHEIIVVECIGAADDGAARQEKFCLYGCS